MKLTGEPSHADEVRRQGGAIATAIKFGDELHWEVKQGNR